MGNPNTGEIYELPEGAFPEKGHVSLSLEQAGQLKELGLDARKAELERLLEKQENIDAEQSIISQHDKVLIATVGLPRSGKTTWAKIQGYPIVNPDSIRLAIHGQRFISEAEPYVWAVAKTMVRALFLAGHRVVVLDATNNTAKRRRDWITHEWATYFKVIDTPEDVCVERATDEGDDYIVPTIKRMAASQEPLEQDEMAWL